MLSEEHDLSDVVTNSLLWKLDDLFDRSSEAVPDDQFVVHTRGGHEVLTDVDCKKILSSYLFDTAVHEVSVL